MKPIFTKKFPEKNFDLERLHMNEKLTEIAINAKVEHCISHVRLQEFAELIIRECANIADTCEPYRSSDVILRHFGVDNGNV